MHNVILALMKPILIYLFTLIPSNTGAPAVKHIRRNSILKDFRQAFHAFQCLLTTSWKFLYLKSKCFMLLLKLLLFSFILSIDAERVIFSQLEPQIYKSIPLLFYYCNNFVPFIYLKRFYFAETKPCLLIFKFHFLPIMHLCRTLLNLFQFVFSLSF